MRHGEVILGLMLAGSAATVWAVQFSKRPSVPDEVVSDRYFSADSGEVKLLGVCDVFGPTVRCWNADQRPNTGLAKQVTDVFSKGSSFTNNPQAEIPLHFHRKNRIAVFQVPGPSSSVHLTGQFGGFSIPNTDYVQTIQGTWQPQADPQIQYIPLDVDRSVTTMSITAKFTFGNDHAITVACSEGASDTPGSPTISIGSIKPTVPWTGGTFDGPIQKSWDVVVKSAGDGPMSRIQVYVDPLDDKGQPIRRVNQNGQPLKPIRKPILPMRPEEIHQIAFNQFNSPMFNRPAGTYMPEYSGRIWKSTVDPKFISRINVYIITPRTVEFKDVPLDPKP